MSDEKGDFLYSKVGNFTKQKFAILARKDEILTKKKKEIKEAPISFVRDEPDEEDIFAPVTIKVKKVVETKKIRKRQFS